MSLRKGDVIIAGTSQKATKNDFGVVKIGDNIKIQDGIISANLDNVYTKDQLYTKNDVYTKSDVYNKTQVYSTEQTYSKEEVYNKLEMDEIIGQATSNSSNSVKNQNNGDAINFWLGTKSEYNNTEHYDNTIYHITDDTVVSSGGGGVPQLIEEGSSNLYSYKLYSDGWIEYTGHIDTVIEGDADIIINLPTPIITSRWFQSYTVVGESFSPGYDVVGDWVTTTAEKYEYDLKLNIINPSTNITTETLCNITIPSPRRFAIVVMGTLRWHDNKKFHYKNINWKICGHVLGDE
jgi:hypothetical protein